MVSFYISMLSALAVVTGTASALAIASAIPEANAPVTVGTIGIRFNNYGRVPAFISGDWAQKDIIANPSLAQADYNLTSGASVFIPHPAGSSPKFYIGLTPNDRSTDTKRDHDTAVEATFIGADKKTYFDVDIERGFSVPVWCHGQNDPWESGSGCMKDMLSTCPAHLRHYDIVTGKYDQCLAEATAASITMRRKLCPHLYVEANDVKTMPVHNGDVVTCWILDDKAPKPGSAAHAAYSKAMLAA